MTTIMRIVCALMLAGALGPRLRAQSGEIPAPPLRTGARQDPRDPAKASNPKTGKNYRWDPAQKTWVDAETTKPAVEPAPARQATGVPASETIDPCLVGIWRSQSVVIGSALTEGGAGILLTLKPDGTETVDYNGMEPYRDLTPDGGTHKWAGAATVYISARNASAAVKTVGSSELKTISIMKDGTVLSNPMRGPGPAALGYNQIDHSYRCDATTLTFRFTAIEFTFKKNGH